MDFNKLINDLVRLEEINKELEELKNPDYIEKRVREVFGQPDEEKEKAFHNELNAAINALINTL